MEDSEMNEQGGDPFPPTGVMVKVYAYACPEKPEKLLGQPIGMFHCPACGCMVIAGVEHAPCFPGDCLAIGNGSEHPGERVVIEMDEGHVRAYEMMTCAIIERVTDGA